MRFFGTVNVRRIGRDEAFPIKAYANFERNLLDGQMVIEAFYIASEASGEDEFGNKIRLLPGKIEAFDGTPVRWLRQDPWCECDTALQRSRLIAARIITPQGAE